MRQARATGRPVTVPALTTPTSVTVARPDGRFAVTESAWPVRARRNGHWENLNPALHRNTSGTLSPAVTTSALTLSGGGTGPLAVMATDARTLSVSWPGGTLPAPTVSGATATYANVYPGVDLAVTASTQGAFSEVLIVHNATAAANPALSSLQFTATAPGLAITATSGGNLQAAPGPGAVPVFTAGAPLAWDSAPPPAGMATVTAQDGTLVDAQTGLPGRLLRGRARRGCAQRDGARIRLGKHDHPQPARLGPVRRQHRLPGVHRPDLVAGGQQHIRVDPGRPGLPHHQLLERIQLPAVRAVPRLPVPARGVRVRQRR